MLQAGYAPVYSAAPLGDPHLAQANEALVQLMKAHEPQPAFVIDAQWNVVHQNCGGLWLALTLMPWAAALLVRRTTDGTSGSTSDNTSPSAPVNLLDMLAHPEGFTRHMTNLAEVGPTLLAHLRDDASVQPALTPKVEAFAALLRNRLGSASLHTGWPSQAAPVLTSRFATAHGE